MNEIYNFLKHGDCYYLATLDGKQPRVRPFMSIKIVNDKLYILTTKDKNVSKQMHKNPKVELCNYNGDEWIRVTAEAVVDDDTEVKQLILDDFPKLAEMYDANDPNVECLYLTNIKATISSFDDKPKVIKL